MRLMNEKNCIFEFYGLYIKRKYISIIGGNYFSHILIIGGVFLFKHASKWGHLKQSAPLFFKGAFYGKNAPFLKKGRFLDKHPIFKKETLS
jgi:hypothetical protein